MLSPVASIVVEWLCLLVAYSICIARILVLWTRKRKSMFAQYDTEVILCLVLVVATCNAGLDTWKNVRLIRVDDGTASQSRRNAEQIFALKVPFFR